MMGHTLQEAVTSGFGVERPFLCPVHQDSRPSASVNVLKNVWYCYTCGAHGEVGGDALLGDVDFHMLSREIEKTLAEPTIYPESWLRQFDPDHPHEYWLSRFKEETCRHFKLGWDFMDNRVTYPLRAPTGDLLGVVRRKLDPDDPRPKYQYPYGIDIGELLFNYHEAIPWAPLVLVEGAVDAMALAEVGVNVVAIYGARMSDTQARLITELDPQDVYTAFDMDKAGYKAGAWVRDLLHGFQIERLTWNARFKDPADMAPETRRRIFAPALV